MSVRRLRLAFLAVGLCVSGCVYYNGMYNANRLARSARKAEREGRTFVANGLWGQVATKAESVIVRHPTSKYAVEAEVLRGVALARLGQCQPALKSLGRLPLITVSRDLTEDALLASGRCHMTAGNLPAADVAFSQVLNSRDPERRREASYQHARVLRQTGRYREALTALAEVRDPRAVTERLLALAGSGRLPEAGALADSMIANGDTTHGRWDSVVIALSTDNPVAASALVDRVWRLPGREKEAQAQLLLEDGLRLAPVDTMRAARRFRQALGLAGNSNAAGRAGLELIRLRLAGVSQPRELSPLLDSLRVLSGRYSGLADQFSQLRTRIAAVHAAGAAMIPDTGQADMRLFLAAESARDSLGAPLLAETMFRQLPEQFPWSAYAPKAILATQGLDPTWSDSARALLEERYFDSPYLAMVRGETTQAYRDLEDSLGSFAAAGIRTPTIRRKPVDDNDAERRPRRRTPPRDSRVPEP